ncbi:MAG: UDP-N-acetylglucosamine 2-epimerase (hydrolyzing) [Candidatus Omnitrophica bacterium]|nr:UDP-N-acetylglucosamine 2-epimerase (hydrolyzing) [Candidatus Omnitrophota bacterium]
MKKICFITSSRAEYGLLRPLLREVVGDSDLKSQLIATGMHLESDFGLTYKEIEQDGFSIDEKIEIFLNSDTPVGISKSISLGISGLSEAYDRLKPDIVVVLGDRFEILSAAIAAHIARIPIAHIHGGEVTQGSFDDAFRHSMTKMSHLHFTSTEDYRRRVIQLGESPERVFNVGALGVDNIKGLKLLSKEELEKDLDFKFQKHNLLVTFHPVTLESNTSEGQFKNLLDVLEGLDQTGIILTKSNADVGGRVINKMIDQYVNNNSQKAKAFTSLGNLKYLSTMQLVDAVVGNSSSGIIEALSFKIGTINIGDRQKGRIRAESIIDCEPTKEEIKASFEKLYSKEFQQGLASVVSPYGDGQAAKRINHIFKNFDVKGSLKKAFYDLDFNVGIKVG